MSAAQILKYVMRIALFVAVVAVIILAFPPAQPTYAVCEQGCTIYPYPVEHPKIPPIRFGLTPTL